jgi:hypothetical protein
MRRSFALMLPLLLAGCPLGMIRMPAPPKIVHVEVVKYVAVPSELTEPCPVYEAVEQTYSEAKRLALLRRASIIDCDHADKAKIRALGAPAVTP